MRGISAVFWTRRYFSASVGDALSNKSAIPM
jgi:hypothetical protein